MSLKLSAGCQCCDTQCSCSDMSGTAAEYDLTFSGWSGSPLLSCDTGSLSCDFFDDTFTMQYPYNHTHLSGGTCSYWSAFFYNDETWWVWANSNCVQVPDYTTWICTWNYVIPYAEAQRCRIETTIGMDDVVMDFYINGWTLARFQISGSSYIWRIVPHYWFHLECNYMGMMHDDDTTAWGWWWEYDSGTTQKCDFDGTETWTLTSIGSLSVSCYQSHTLDLSDFCVGTLMPSVVTG